MLKVIFLYLFIILYDKLKENLKVIIEDVLKIIVFPIKIISLAVWKWKTRKH